MNNNSSPFNKDGGNAGNGGEDIVDDSLSDFATAVASSGTYEFGASVDDGIAAADATSSMRNAADKRYIYGGRNRRSSSIL